MIRFAASCLLWCLSYLLPRLATAQAIKPLPPVVVQLQPGDVVRQRLIGLDSATYQVARHALELVPAADALQADLRREAELHRQQLAAIEAELRRCRAGEAHSEAEFQQLAGQARQAAAQPVRPPLLLDTHTYQGAGLGAVALVLLKLFVFR